MFSSRLLTGAAFALAMVMTFHPATPRAQSADVDVAHTAFDELLDTNVRDGFVYYRALKADRGRLDRYVSSLAGASLASASREAQMAFWLNAYNALVLRTVVDSYPIAQHTNQYPAHSIRQIPGAFERTPHTVAGKTLTLDQLEQTVLSTFHDPRVFLAIGRGAVGGGRLRSEAYTADRLEQQLADDAGECATRAQCVHVDTQSNHVQVSSIFSWRRNDFIEAYAGRAPETFAARSPIERAIIALVSPQMLAAERDFLEKNTFTVEYVPFDWSLNDLDHRRF
jgi:hypothetical protein